MACAAPTGPGPEAADITKADPLKADTSAEALFLDFKFSGELITDSSWNPEKQIEDQLLYTVGQLNGDNSIGRLDSVQLSNVVVGETPDGRVHLTYNAVMPVAWGDRDNIPANYEFQLPLDVSSGGQEAFTEKYSHSCVDYGAHDVTAGIYWYYYRPAQRNCHLEAEDLVVTIADIGPSPIQTTGMFPEYDKVWEDDAFKIVAIFGKYEDDATSSSDAGIRAYNRFLEEVAKELRTLEVVTEPADVPRNPGVEAPEVTFSATRADGTTIEVVAILVDNVRTAGPEFNQRYAELTPEADLIIYNGHAGLGANIRALARKGEWRTGQYSIVFMNGCDTYAYVDDALYTAHAAVNSDDPEGSKYVDIVMNAMPALFREMPAATMALIRGLADDQNPHTYEQIFADISDYQVVLVSGEHDNTFVPGGGDPDEPPPGGLGGHGRGRARRSQRRASLRDAAARRGQLPLRDDRVRRRRPLRAHR
ncbi:MAG: hypothetical protein DRJ42_15755 [Deltaproteobacteria bacterium]|nr:MAG: hypothetical protein DRJ42_15755 [Deltaproteobacteria bacterium]